jgi:hypothetical protein
VNVGINFICFLNLGISWERVWLHRVRGGRGREDCFWLGLNHFQCGFFCMGLH